MKQECIFFSECIEFVLGLETHWCMFVKLCGTCLKHSLIKSLACACFCNGESFIVETYYKALSCPYWQKSDDSGPSALSPMNLSECRVFTNIFLDHFGLKVCL